jgi:hypothetical protein
MVEGVEGSGRGRILMWVYYAIICLVGLREVM